jgi:DNA invertase Pin-like site-specific DNA recombinase
LAQADESALEPIPNHCFQIDVPLSFSGNVFGTLKLMLVGYARVTTLDQNPEMQADALTAAGCERVFTEKASGARKDRPQLKAALDYMRNGDTLVVWKLSRLARSLKQIIETTCELQERGIGLTVLTQNIDTSTPEGRLFFHMTGAFDEFQRELIVENTRAGLATARREGRKGGRPPRMTKETIRAAESMIKDRTNYEFITDIIEQLGIGRTTFYRHFPPQRIRELRIGATK